MVKDNKRKYAIIVLLIIMIAGVTYLCIEAYKVYEQREQYAKLSNFLYEEKKENNNTSNEQTNKATVRMEKLQELSKENSDIVGWLEISNTTINYPVLQCDNNDFYLTHDYLKKYTALGSIFVDKDVNIKKPSSNFLIYGHRNKSNMMFEELFKYKDNSFYEEHPKIRFTTLTNDFEYEIISSFYAKSYDVNDKNENEFKFYNFIDANSEDEFNNYIDNIKKLSIYNIDTTAKYGEQLITLCTCEYSQENGRFVVVAKKASSIS